LHRWCSQEGKEAETDHSRVRYTRGQIWGFSFPSLGGTTVASCLRSSPPQTPGWLVGPFGYDSFTRDSLPLSSHTIRPVIATAALKNATAALQEVVLLNHLETFILECARLSTIHRKPARLRLGQVRRVPRTNERPTYTILRPREIPEQVKPPTPAGKWAVTPHERRSHLRTLRSELFCRGKRILMPASWVGPSESIVGKAVHGAEKT
jgi:hypothetical protein